jgi:tRNA-specific 2-thiouridylase
MPVGREKVVVAMSGGVDSSVAACLLVEQGYDVIGLFMRVGRGPVNDTARDGVGGVVDSGTRPAARTHQGCCSAADAADARFVAGLLGIPFYALNFEEDFDGIIDYFADEYARGRTPNPCVVCNDKLKFGRLMDYADAVGAKYVATGHYARIDRTGEGPRLLRAVDRRKDQSYVLFGLRRGVLDRVLFPLGDLQKSEVRRIAARHGFPNHDKPDSVEICFAPDRDYARVVRDRRPKAFTAGDVVDNSGRVLGRHHGIANYTIGQRRGLGIAAGKPIYVTALDVLNNRVTVGSDQDLACPALLADRVNLLGYDLGESFRADVKIRYLHEAVPATVYASPLDKGGLRGVCVRVVFDELQRAVTPGQAVVFYDGDFVLGGGWIAQAEAPMPCEAAQAR